MASTRFGSGAPGPSRSARTAQRRSSGIHERYERELGNDLGNLLSRTTAMVARYRDGTLAAVPSPDGVVATALGPLAGDVAARLDAFDITGALERIWEVVRILNREVETTAPWQLAKDPLRADELDRVLYDLVDGLRVVAVALAAYVPTTAAAILEALGQPGDARLVERRLRAHRARRTASWPRPRCSRGSTRPWSSERLVIDTHAHLDGCDEPAAFLVERARAVGVTRIVTIGTGIASMPCGSGDRRRPRRASSRRSASTRIRPASRTPNDSPSCVELLDDPAVVAVGEIGLDYFHDRAPRDVQRALFDGSSSSPRRPGCRS